MAVVSPSKDELVAMITSSTSCCNLCINSVSLMSSGAYDLAVEVKGSNLKDVAFFVSERLATIDGILSTSTHFILKKYKEKGIFIDNEEPDERGLC